MPIGQDHPLKDPLFRRLWGGATLSLLGDQFYLVALPLIILKLTGSALAMGTILMAAALPRTALMLVGGVVSDRFSPRRIMMTTATLRALLVGAMAALLALGILQLWEIYAIAIAFGIADAFAMPAGQSYLPFLVPRDRLLAANSALQTSAQLVTIAGPAPAGLFVQFFGAPWALFIDAISFLFIPLAFRRLPDPPVLPNTPAGRPPLWRAIGEGLSYVRRDGALTALMLTIGVINFSLSGPLAVALPFLATRSGGSATYGALVSCVAAGSFLGTLTAGFWKPRRRGWLMIIDAAVLGLCEALVGFLPEVWQSGALLLAMGITSGFVNIHIVSWIQQRIEPEWRGRAMSILTVFSMGLMPISMALTGVLVSWSLDGTFILAGAATMAAALGAAFHRSVRDIE